MRKTQEGWERPCVEKDGRRERSEEKYGGREKSNLMRKRQIANILPERKT